MACLYAIDYGRDRTSNCLFAEYIVSELSKNIARWVEVCNGIEPCIVQRSRDSEADLATTFPDQLGEAARLHRELGVLKAIVSMAFVPQLRRVFT